MSIKPPPAHFSIRAPARRERSWLALVGLLGYQLVRSYKRFHLCGASGLRKDEGGIVK